MTEAAALGAWVSPWVHANSAARQGQVLELLAAHLAGAACSAGFPELAHVPLLRLRHFAAATPVERFRSAARGLAAALEANAQFVAAARARAGVCALRHKRAAGLPGRRGCRAGGAGPK